MFKTASISLCAALAAMLAISSPAAAQQRDTRSTAVTHRDLDLSSVEGRAELGRRIDNAARQVCGVGERQLGSNIMTRESRECYRSTKREMEQHFAQIIADNTRAG
ncbi:UrcA family protein [Alteraurantiacibacter palmitatis]|uniref:UrcA family protein n=1 Tax=Alteraurantiacibacter palmitatis TaxID=2054628 RepID=A0ABV7E3U9_9SPHN